MISDSPSPPTAPSLAKGFDRFWWSVFALATLLGLLHNFAVLLGYGPDELRHMNYVTLMLDEHRLPQILADGTEYRGAHPLHPPYYYALLLPLIALFRGFPDGWDWHVARLVSLILCLGALVLLRQIALVAGADKPASARSFALFVVVGVGLLPIFGMTAGTINNDSAMLFCVTWFLWLLAVKFPRDQSFKAAIVLGLVFGLGGGVKATALICNGVALVAYLWAQNGTRGLFTARTLARFATVIGVTVLVCGWWYGRNQLIYGRLTPIAQGYSPADLGYIPAASEGMLTQIMHPNFPGLVGQALVGIFDSLWSQKDWIPETLRAPIYWSLFAFVALGLCGLFVAKRGAARANVGANLATDGETDADARLEKRGEFEDATNDEAPSAFIAERDASDALAGASVNAEAMTARRIALWSGGAALAVNAAACLFFALFVHWGWFEGGRYLLASLGGLMMLLALGWRSILPARLFGAAPFVLALALLGLNVLTLVHLTTVLNPIARAGTMVVAP